MFCGMSHSLTIPGRPARRCKQEEDAQSLLEFALALPVLLLIVTAVLFFGLSLFDYLMLNEATEVAARQLAISRGQTLDPCQTVAKAFYASAPSLLPSSLIFSTTLNGVTYSSTSTCSGSASVGAPANMVLGSNAVVTVTYPCKLTLFGDIISSGFLLTARTSEQIQ